MKYLLRLMQVAMMFAVVSFGLVHCSSPQGVGGACTADEGCAAGLKCVEGKCAKPDRPDGGGGDGGVQPKTCKEDKDCDPKTEFCKDGKCTKRPDGCTKSEECGKGYYCDNGDKKCKKIKCTSDNQCGDKEICDTKTGECKTAKTCAKTEDCGDAGLVCNTCRKLCVPSLKSGKCDFDFNCPGGIENSYCDTCVKECRKKKSTCEACTDNKECGEPDDFCLPDQLNPESGQKFCGRKCTQGSVCPAGYKCKKFEGDAYKDSPFQCVPASGDCANPGECRNNADCKGTGKICDPSTQRCVPGCQVDANCSVIQRGKCKTKADCTNSNAICDNNTCSIQQKCCRNRCGTPCGTDSDCEGKEKCDKGCCKLDDECQSSKDCPAKSYCDKSTSLCTPGCQEAADCGASDPQKPRCRWTCKANKCEEDCRCRSQHLDCTPIRFCPKPEDIKKDPLAPCRKPAGPVCKTCSNDEQCGCKPGDDCKFACTKKQCQSPADCKGMPNGATACYNGRCSTKKACATDKDCPGGEKCENNFCAENCHNRCLQFQTGNVCVSACDPRGDGSECAARLSCMELLPQSASGPPCPGKGQPCQKNSDCTGKYKFCAPDGYCTVCSKGKVCRGLDPKDPLKLICIDMPPTVCMGNPETCKSGGF